MFSAYKRALKGNKKEVTYVVAKKHQGNRRPKGVRGKYKMVDSRMRKDKRAEEKKNKLGKKSKSKAKPNKGKQRPMKAKVNRSQPKPKPKGRKKGSKR